MPKGLVRYQKCRALHFITFSGYRRRPPLAIATVTAASSTSLSLCALRTRCRRICAHARARSSAPGRARSISLAMALQLLKQNTSRKLNRTEDQFRQRQYYASTSESEEKRLEKLRYIHRNPVRRGLVANPEDGPWSSFFHYGSGWQSGDRVTMDRSTLGTTENTSRSSMNLCFPPFA